MDQQRSPLRRLRESRGLTLAEVAAGTGIDTGQLSRIERGSQKSVTKAEELVRYFGAGITETEILYPERFPEAPPRQRRARAAA